LLFGRNLLSSKIEKKKSKSEEKYLQDRDSISFLRYSLDQIGEYYVINKSQARNTYWAAIIMSFLGFLGIVTVVASWSYNGEKLRILVPLSGIAASIFLEFIAFSLLNIYQATLQQLNSYFIQLIRAQELLISLELINALESETERDARKSEAITMLFNTYQNPYGLRTPELELKARRRNSKNEDKLDSL
jgi:hypothetical protein